MKKEIAPPELLRKLLRYEPETGKLFWLPRPTSMFSSNQACGTWNTKYAHKEALTANGFRGYKCGSLLGRMYVAHRIAWAIFYGKWPIGQIDHINGNGTDNRLVNLRDVPASINQRNAKMQKNNTSGFNGVMKRSAAAGWRAQIRINGKTKHLGSYKCLTAAVIARKKAEQGLGYTKRHGINVINALMEKHNE